MDLAGKPHLGLCSEKPGAFAIEENKKRHITGDNQHHRQIGVQLKLAPQLLSIQSVVSAGERRQRIQCDELQYTYHGKQPQDLACAGISPANREPASNHHTADQVQPRLGFDAHAGPDQTQRSEKTENACKEEDR